MAVGGVRRALARLQTARWATALVVLTLAAGSGVSAALVAIIDGVWLRAVPSRDASRLALLSVRTPYNDNGPFQWSDVRQWREAGSWPFEQFAVFTAPRNITLETQGRTQLTSARAVDISLLRVLGVSPLVGRFFIDTDISSSVFPPVVVSEKLWRSRLGANTQLGDLRAVLDGQAAAVVGVLPDRLEPVVGAAVLRPLWAPVPGQEETTRSASLSGLGRLASGHTLASAEQALARQQMPASGAVPRRPVLVGLRDSLVGADVGRALSLLAAAVALVLAGACANVSLVMLAGMARRQWELRMKTVLGAPRGLLVRELMAEGLLLAAAGTTVGLLLAATARQSVVALAPPRMPRVDEIVLNPGVIAVTLLLASATAVAMTVFPALAVTRDNASTGLLPPERAGGYGRSTTRAIKALTALQSGVAVVVLVAAAILGRTLLSLMHVDLGFDPANVAAITVSNPSAASGPAAWILEQQAVDVLRRRPDVVAVGVTDQLPLDGSLVQYAVRTTFDDAAVEALVAYRRVSPGYFRAMGIPFKQGRTFDERAGPDCVRETIVNEQAATLLWRGASPLGRTLSPGGPVPLVVVGVVADVRAGGIDQTPLPEMYRCRSAAGDQRLGGAVFAVRTRSDPEPFIAQFERGSTWLVPGVRVFAARTLRDLVDRFIAGPRFRASLVTLFGLLLLVLTVAGVVGVTARTVAMSTREIGIRMALGAAPHTCVLLVVRRCVGAALLGAVTGTLLAVLAIPQLRVLLHQSPGADMPSLAAGTVVVALSAILASFLAARRVTDVDPAVALRSE